MAAWRCACCTPVRGRHRVWQAVADSPRVEAEPPHARQLAQLRHRVRLVGSCLGDAGEQRQGAAEDGDDDETGDEFSAQIRRHAEADQQPADKHRRQNDKLCPLSGGRRLKPGVEIDVGQWVVLRIPPHF